MKVKYVAKMLMVVLVISTLSGCGSTAKDTMVQTETSEETNDTTEATEEAKEDAELTEEEIAAKEAEEAAAKEAEEAAAKEARANEYYEAGRVSLYGLDGTDVNLETAYNNFEKAKELGKNDANFYLGVLRYWYNYPERNFEMAKTYFEECGDNPYAQISLGFLYFSGAGVDEDREKAKELFQTAIDNGCMDGYLGDALVAYEEEQYDIGFEYYNKVVEEGKEQLYIAYAMYWIGGMYDCGEGVEQDYAQALDWYEKAIEMGHNPYAMNNLGAMYYYGNGVEQDYEKALECFEKAADLGVEEAAENAEYLRQLLAQ